jgi:hypothetical protein
VSTAQVKLRPWIVFGLSSRLSYQWSPRYGAHALRDDLRSTWRAWIGPCNSGCAIVFWPTCTLAKKATNQNI